MKIAIGADHGGFALKKFIIQNYAQKGIILSDLGTFSEQSCDYPLVAEKMAAEITNNNADMGILICGTGIGISIAANRHKGIRAALLYDEKVAALAREHNDANVAVFGARIQNQNDVLRYLDIFFNTKFSGDDRHCRRISELDK